MLPVKFILNSIDMLQHIYSVFLTYGIMLKYVFLFVSNYIHGHIYNTILLNVLRHKIQII